MFEKSLCLLVILMGMLLVTIMVIDSLSTETPAQEPVVTSQPVREQAGPSRADLPPPEPLYQGPLNDESPYLVDDAVFYLKQGLQDLFGFEL
jgi:hypothetical protein